MTLRQLNNDFSISLSDKFDKSEVVAMRDIIFEWAGIRKYEILTDPLKEPASEIVVAVKRAILQLRSDKPIQYITGEAWFYKLKFQVSDSVLIPRPETEELVELIALEMKQTKKIEILDIGTGSGCIAITLKKLLPQAKMTAIDISGNALRVAKANADFHKTRVHFFKTNFLDDKTWTDFEKFDVIVSNPPYIPVAEEQLMNKNVTRFEPHLALFVPDDRPYIFYEKIAAFAQTHLNDHGKIFLEVHEDHAKQVAALFDANNFVTEIKMDISGKERMVFARNKE